MKFQLLLFVVALMSVLCLGGIGRSETTSYQCGVSKHDFRPLVSHGWRTEQGRYPWHVALFHRIESGPLLRYACGATLINEWHVLTAAHCVVKQAARNSQLAVSRADVELHFGQHNLSMTDGVVIRDVKKVHVHPEYATNRNDIAVLVTRLKVEYSENVIPICLDQRVDRDLRDLEGRRGWVTGWGTTENGTISEVLQSLSLPVVSYEQCLQQDRILYGRVLDENVFCAGDRNGTSPGQGDSGGGFFIRDSNRWVIRGIVAIGKMDKTRQGIDMLKYTVFVNVRWYMSWITEVLAESEPHRDKRQKRISEIECERFQRLVEKKSNGDCYNNLLSHSVMVTTLENDLLCNGILVNENNVLTTCTCIRDYGEKQYWPVKVRFDTYGDVAVAEMFCHPNYFDTEIHDNLAVLKLRRDPREIQLMSSLIPACLASNWTENLYDNLLKATFVKVKPAGWIISRLKYGAIFFETNKNLMVSKEICNEEFETELLDREFCTLNNQSIDDALSTGDGLQSRDGHSCMFTIVGVKTGTATYPPGSSDNEDDDEDLDLYALVSSYLDWIEQAVWNAQPDGSNVACGTSAADVNGWRWSVAIFRWDHNSSTFEPSCSGTLINLNHILTTAQCVVNRTTGRVLPEETFQLLAGLQCLDQRDVNVQIRYVSEVHIYPDDSVHDVAILKTSWPFQSTRHVNPICIPRENNSIFRNINDQLVYISCWETARSEDRDALKSRILGLRKCSEAMSELLGNVSFRNMHCAAYDRIGSDENEPEKASKAVDRGRGLYYDLGDATWGLVGIVSTLTKDNATGSYALYVNIQPYITWIEETMTKQELLGDKRPKRISERECDRFVKLANKTDGVCENAGYPTIGSLPHIVLLVNDQIEFICAGILVREDRVLTACECIRGEQQPTKIVIGTYGILDILKMICHPKYNSTTSYHDLAVLQLANPVELSSHLIPACLANTWTENLNDYILYSTFVRYSFAEHPKLRSKYDFIVSKQTCDNITATGNGEKYTPLHSQFCVSHDWIQFNGLMRYGLFLEKDIVSGGIAQLDDSRTCRFTVVGIGSNGTYNADLSGFVPQVAILHRVAYYLDWIEQVVWDDEFPVQQQNWILVSKASSNADSVRYRQGLGLLVLCILLAII